MIGIGEGEFGKSKLKFTFARICKNSIVRGAGGQIQKLCHNKETTKRVHVHHIN